MLTLLVTVNAQQSVTAEQSNKRLHDGIERLDKQCNDATRSSPELIANTHYTRAQQLLADSKLRLSRCELLNKMAQALERAISTAKKDREWKPLLGVVEWLAHKFPELSTKQIDILPKSSAKLPTVGQAPPQFETPTAPIEWKKVEPDLVEERLRTDVRKACLETHKLSQSFCLSEQLEETIANARDQRYEWGITQLETCLQDVLSQCPDLAGSTQVQIAQKLLQELKDEEKERKVALKAALKELQQIAEECRQSLDDEKLRGAIKKVLEKHPDADASKEVCEAKILVEQLARQVLQAAFDRAKIEKQPKPLHEAILRFRKNPVQEPTSMNASRHLVSESEALLQELEALHKKLASAQRQLADCLNGCYNSRVSGALQKCVDRIEKDFPDIKHGGVLAMHHPAGQELKKCKENLKIFIQEEEEFDKELNAAMEGDWRSINAVLEKALQRRPAYENREVVQKAIDTISHSTKSPVATKSPIVRAKSLASSVNNDSDYDSAFDDFDDDDSPSPRNGKSPRNVDRFQADGGNTERKDEYGDDGDLDDEEW